MVLGAWTPAAGGLLREAIRGVGAEAARQFLVGDAKPSCPSCTCPAWPGCPACPPPAPPEPAKCPEPPACPDLAAVVAAVRAEREDGAQASLTLVAALAVCCWLLGWTCGRRRRAPERVSRGVREHHD